MTVKCEHCEEEFENTQGLSGHMRLKHPEMPPRDKPAMVTKSVPTEQLVKEMLLPTLADGQREVFDAGVQYGIKSILVGVRVAQELSKMGIDQATPIIKMAQEMRQAESQVAQQAAEEAAIRAASETAKQVAEYFEQKKPDIATVPQPFEGLMAKMMETAMTNLMGAFFPQGSTPAGFTVRKVKEE